MESMLAEYLAASATAAQALAEDAQAARTLAAMAGVIAPALAAGGKLLIAGNGGSAADAQHLACEFVSRLMIDRGPLAALALAESGPILTGCGNDYGFDQVFARQVTALGRPGDVLLALSTSGRSPNLLAALAAARAAGLACLGFAGAAPSPMDAACDQVFRAPSAQGQIVQQLHIAAGHALLAAIERQAFPQA